MKKEYTEAQKKAISWNDGAVVVLAGPGSGKTAVLTDRIRRILTESIEDSFRILALTFTNKAAQEMSERISDGTDDLQHRLFVGTFHSFCSEILRNHGSYVDLKSNFDIYSSDDDLNEVLEDVCERYKQIDSSFPYEDLKLLNMIRFFERKLCYTSEDVDRAMPKNQYAVAYKWIYLDYLKTMISKSTLDFDMLILLAYRLFVTKPAIARIYSRTYKYINIDEFQDTNFGQYMLLVSMCGERNNNIFIVADDDQVIYGWNGADHKRILEFKEKYKADLIQLNQNFRCPKDVIQAANSLIAHNSGREKNKKPLEAMLTESSPTSHIFCNRYANQNQEVEAIAKIVKTINSHSLGDSICVLARTNRLLDLAYRSTNDAGIECEKAKRKNDFETPYVLWIYLLLKLANHRTDKKILNQLLGVMSEGININLNGEEVLLEASVSDEDLLKALRVKSAGLFKDETFEKSLSINLVEGKNFIQFISDAFNWSEKQLNLIEDCFHRKQMKEEYELEKKIWTDFQRHLAYNYELDDILLSTYIQEFAMVSKEKEPKPGAVQFLTIHASKGKEFDHVILIGMVNDELPSFQSVKKGVHSAEMEEERRNCFVAITRAKKKLFISFSENYFGWNKQQSIFLKEMFPSNESS